MPSKLLKHKTTWYYDLETFKNIFTAYFVNAVTGEKRCFVICDIGEHKYFMFVEMLKFIASQEVTHLIGYNNIRFDDRVLSYLYMHRRELFKMSVPDLTRCIWEVSQLIIKNDRRLTIYKWKAFHSTDLFKTFGYSRARVSLKRCAVALNFPQVQDLPLHYEAECTEDMVMPLISYNYNDVAVTQAVAENKDDEFILREFLYDKYHTDFYNSDRTRIGKDIFINYWNQGMDDPNYILDNGNVKLFQTSRKSVALKDVIFPYIKFETKEFQDIAERVRNKVIRNVFIKKDNKYKFREWDEEKQKWKTFGVEFDIDGLHYKIGGGGIHSTNKKEIYEATENYILGELDAATYYPRLMVVGKIFPEHFRKYAKKFVSTIDKIINERLFWKHHPEKKNPLKKAFIKLNDSILKITINSLFGLFKSRYFCLRDAKATLAVTVNGELLLLKLIEMLKLKGVRIVSANTDGIVYYCHKDKYPAIEECVKEWEAMTGVDMEIAKYKKMIFSNVNSYIWETDKGELKQKGEFLPTEDRDFERDMSMGIVVDACNSHFIRGIPIDETINECSNIYKFLICKRMGIEGATKKQFRLHIYSPEGEQLEEQQKTTRFYASNSGNLLKKVGDTRSEFMIVNQPCIVYNTHIDKDIIEYDIDHEYYIEEAAKIVSGFTNLSQN